MKTNIKMRVTPEQSKKVQEICFENSIYWWSGGKIVIYMDCPFLFIGKNNITQSENESFYIGEKEEEIDADLFIRTNGTCEEKSNYERGDFLKCIVFYDIGVRVGATYQIQTVDNYNSRITFLDDDLDTRSIEISRLNKYFKKVENKYTELSTSIDKPYNVPILEAKLKKKNEILKKARIKRKNQREELHKLNLKLQKCISLEEHNKIVENINKDNVNYLSNNILSRDKEIEKLKAVIEYLESKVK